MQQCVLVVEDESDVVDLLRYHLMRTGFDVLVATSGTDGLEMAQKHRPHAIILDLMLPGMDGITVCRKLRRDPDLAGMAVLMLTARGEVDERVKGLEVGADDYVTKPFSPKEIVLRVQALLRRTQVPALAEVLEFDGLRINKKTFDVRMEGRRIDLTTTEFKLLCLLIEHRGHVQSRESMLYDVWGYNNTIDTRTVDTHIRRLREKLGAHAPRLQTIRGEGYLFQAD
jgi:two-component system, OmpR family, phosphate regulon response regulator PhoB